MLTGTVTLHIITEVVIAGLTGATEEELILAALHKCRQEEPQVVKYEVLVDDAAGSQWSLWHDWDFLENQHRERLEDEAQIFSIGNFEVSR